MYNDDRYRDIDRAAMNWLRSLGVWLCPICGATREVEDKTEFERQPTPQEPCRLCGKRLIHGIRGDDGKVGSWYPRWWEEEREPDVFIHVKGYTRSDGKQIGPHLRSRSEK